MNVHNQSHWNLVQAVRQKWRRGRDVSGVRGQSLGFLFRAGSHGRLSDLSIYVTDTQECSPRTMMTYVQVLRTQVCWTRGTKVDSLMFINGHVPLWWSSDVDELLSKTLSVTARSLVQVGLKVICTSAAGVADLLRCALWSKPNTTQANVCEGSVQARDRSYREVCFSFVFCVKS